MTANIFTGWENLTVGIITPIALSIGSTCVRVAQQGWHGLRHFICELLLAIFVGLCIHWALTAYEAPPTLVAAIVSASSFFCGVIMDALRKRLVHEILTRGSPDAGQPSGMEDGQ